MFDHLNITPTMPPGGDSDGSDEDEETVALRHFLAR